MWGNCFGGPPHELQFLFDVSLSDFTKRWCLKHCFLWTDIWKKQTNKQTNNGVHLAHVCIAQSGFGGGLKKIGKKYLDKPWPKFRCCQLANLWDRRWRWIVFCLVNPRPLRFLTCNTSPSISWNHWLLLALLPIALLSSLSIFIAQHWTFSGHVRSHQNVSKYLRKNFTPQSC